MSPTMPAYLTVPALAECVGMRVDRLRLVLRRRSDLRAMLRSAGPVRVLAPADLESFRSALACPTPAAAASVTSRPT